MIILGESLQIFLPDVMVAHQGRKCAIQGLRVRWCSSDMNDRSDVLKGRDWRKVDSMAYCLPPIEG